MFGVCHIQNNGVIPFHYFISRRVLFNSLSSDQNKYPCKSYAHKNLTFQLTTLGFTKLLALHLIGSCLVYNIVKGMVDSIFTISLPDKSFLMISQATQTKIVCKSYVPKKVNVPTYHFKVDKIIGISYSRVIFRVHPI